ncbi:short-chain dehydrogenase [Lipomyces kononenkoae]
MSLFSAATTGREVVNAFREQIYGKTFAVTGPSAKSLGARTAVMLAAANPKQILLLGRSEAKIKPVIEEINAINSAVDARFCYLDLSDLDSVRSAAENINASIDKIDVLINYAGIMAVKEFETSKEGIEIQFAANHIGHFLLTNLLMPKLVAAGPGARIVNVSSIGYLLSEVRFEDLNFQDGKCYIPWLGYGQSKTANILFSVALEARLKKRGISSFSVHPGTIFNTNLGLHLDDESFDVLRKIAQEKGMPTLEEQRLKSVDEGCATALVAALDPSLESGASGAFLSDCVIENTREYAHDPDNAEKLWQLSEAVTGQKFSY